MIELCLLGGASLSGEQGPIRGRGAQRRRLALLAVLAVTNRPISRDKLIAMLWPEHDADSARRLLSESMYVIRKATSEDAILAVSDDVELNTSVVRSDVAAFAAAMGTHDYETAVRLYRGPFLDGFFISDAPEFEQWADVHREQFERASLEALEALAHAAAEAGDVRGAVTWWRRLGACDAMSARIALGLMHALEAAGDRAGALQHARIHASLLSREFDAEPDPDVEAYAGRLRDAPTQLGAATNDAAGAQSSATAEPIPPPAAPRRASADGRRLAAVMFTDIVGYTALMQADESAAVFARSRHRDAVHEAARLHGGEVVQFLGDGSFTIYGSAVEAVRAAIDVHTAAAQDPHLPLRIGIHQGEIARDEQGFFGDAVNIAARLQSIAPAGGILVSGKVRDEIRNQKSLPVIACGQFDLKNVAEPMAVYAIAAPGLNTDVSRPSPVAGARVDGNEAGGPHAATTGGPPGPSLELVHPSRGRALSLVSRSMRSTRSKLVIAALVTVGLAYVSITAWRGGGGEVTDSTRGEDVWAIFPCNTQTTPEFANLTNAVALLLGPALDELVGFRAVDHHALHARLERRRSESTPGPAEAAQIAERFNASAFVLCTIFESQGNISLEAKLYESGEQPVRTAHAAGTDVIPLVDSVGIALIGHVVEGRGQTGIRLELPTAMLGAFQWYIEGERQFLATNYAAASEAFERAVQADPGFALAHYRASMAYEWDFNFNLAGPAIRRAVQHGERLSVKDRQLARAWQATLDGRFDEAERIYDEILDRYPDDVEARASRAEVLVHFNPLRNLSSAAAQADLDRVLAELPAYGEVRFHRMELAAMAGDSSTFHEMMAGVDPSNEQFLAWQAVRAFRWGTASEQEQILAQLADATERSVMIAVGRVGAHLHDFAAAWRINDALIQPDRTPDWRAAGHLLRGELAIASGRFAEAQSEYARAAEREPSWRFELATLARLHPFAQTNRTDLQAWRDTLASWSTDERTNTGAWFFVPHADAHALLKAYLIGLLSVSLGDDTAAEEARRQVVRYVVPSADFTGGLGTSIRARVLLRSGRAVDTTTALRLLQQPIISPLERVIASRFFSRAHDRFLRGEVHLARGESMSADSVFSGLLEGFDATYAAPAHLRIAEIRDAMADTNGALRHYARFVELWASADPELQPMVEHARNRLQALRRN